MSTLSAKKEKQCDKMGTGKSNNFDIAIMVSL